MRGHNLSQGDGSNEVSQLMLTVLMRGHNLSQGDGSNEGSQLMLRVLMRVTT